MADCRVKYSTNIINDIYEISGVGRTSAKIIKGNEILFPIGGLDGNNKRLLTKNNTYNWANSVANKINSKYNSSAYGVIATVDNTNSTKGTLLHITIPKLLIDAIEVNNDQRAKETLLKDMQSRDVEGNQKFNEEGDVYFQNVSSGQPDSKLKSLLLEFCKKNGIKVDFIESLLTRFGNDYTAVYESLNKTISIAKSKEGLDTLPEEVGHAILEGLGGSHVLVSRLYHLISKTDYKSKLDPEYQDIISDESTLIKEYAGQLVGQSILKTYKGDVQIKSIIDRIIDLFLNLFKNSSQTELNNIKNEIDKITSSLSKRVLSGDKLSFVTPINPSTFYQINKPVYDEKYTKHLRLLQRRVKTLELRLKSLKSDSDNYKATHSEIEALKTDISDFKKTGDIDVLFKVGKAALAAAKEYIIKLETDKIKLTADKSDDWEYTEYIISTFKDFKGLREEAGELEDRLLSVSKKIVEDLVNSSKSTKESISYEDIESQKSDINRFTMGTGALVDLGDYLARTIGSLIKAAQNKISTFQKSLADNIKTETDLLRSWAKSNGISEDEMYDVFIQEGKNTTHLTKEYSSEWYSDVNKAYKAKDYIWIRNNSVKRTVDGKEVLIPVNKNKYTNPNYTKIQSTPELKRFYEFYNKNITEAFDKLPINSRVDFIPNVFSQTLSDIIKTAPTVGSKLKDGISAFTEVNVKTNKQGDFIDNEEVHQDVIPFQYLKSIDSSKKSRNLADVLYKFGAFAESHEQLSDVLPKARLLQKHIQKKEYVKSSDPNSAISGLNTNLNSMVSKVIDMQLKDKKNISELKLPLGGVYDEKGKRIGDKYILGSDVIDFGLRYNSVLRIGLNPLNAAVNVLVGDIGNIIESFGNRFYGFKDLKKATDIYSSQRLSEKSKLRNVMNILNPLQEMEDYQHSEDLKFKKKIDIDKAKNFMYAPQRMGEDFLQTRTMVAIMLKNKIPGTNVSIWEAINEDGSLKKEYSNNFKTEQEYKDFLNRLTDKIQRVNQMIHGRYSERDAATIQQSVLWRMIFQFKKWIPAALEQRFGKSQFDVRLETDIEGRWRTAFRLFTRVYLERSASALKAGNMTETEIYNMRKNLAELVIVAGVILSTIGLGWNDDDKRKRNPYYKMAMSLLDRVSGDLTFFAKPSEANRLAKSPISLSRTVDDLLKVFQTIPYALSDKVDSRKTTLPERIIKLTPGAKPIKETFDFFNDEKYKQYAGQ